MRVDADQAARAAEFIGRTADAWRRRAFAAEQKLVVADRDRVGAIARLSELAEILQPDLDRNEAGHCDCCYRARRVLSVRNAEVVTLHAGEPRDAQRASQAPRSAASVRQGPSAVGPQGRQRPAGKR